MTKVVKPYIPNKLPLKSIKWENYIELIAKANYEIALYEGILQGIVNPHILLSPLTTQEAVLSSKIEGTQATLEEVLEYEASIKMEESKYQDIQEIINYRKSVYFAISWLKKKPITLNMMKEMHSILLHSVRGRNKARGEFRKIQNWIGRPGSKIEQATYIPPAPNRLMEFLSDLEKYIHYDEKDRLIQLAIIHAQFEIIHPFLDGNGRIGRILIPLFLFEKELLSTPMFYISAYFESNRQEYYDKLKGITKNNDWHNWIEYFLNALIEQSKVNSKKAKSIIGLHDEMKTEIPRITQAHAIKVLDAIFNRPIFNTKDFVNKTKIPKRTAIRILNKLADRKTLKVLEEGIGSKPTVYIFPELLKIIG